MDSANLTSSPIAWIDFEYSSVEQYTGRAPFCSVTANEGIALLGYSIYCFIRDLSSTDWNVDYARNVRYHSAYIFSIECC